MAGRLFSYWGEGSTGEKRESHRNCEKADEDIRLYFPWRSGTKRSVVI